MNLCRGIIATLLICFTLPLVSCGDDGDEPGQVMDKIVSLQELAGTWLSSENEDYIIVTLANAPSDFVGNRMVYCKNGMTYDFGVPRIWQEYQNPDYEVQGNNNRLTIVGFDSVKGILKIYDGSSVNEFHRYFGGVSYIYNETSTAYSRVEVEVYDSRTNSLVYKTQLGGIAAFNGKSYPFWTGGAVTVNVTAKCYKSDGSYETARWTDIDSQKYTTLNM